ncbi:Uncharacterised protein [Vibrio cholerae]|nr:Uncharacterised protein [Vibrio cholerae]
MEFATQDGVKRRKVPNRRNMFWCFQWVSCFKVGRLKEVSSHLWIEEQHIAEQE